MAAGERLKLLMESQKGKPNGVAGLNESGKVPSGQLPAMDYVPTSRKVNGKALTADITLSAADTGAIPVAEKGATGGVATLDDSGKVPREQLPAMNYDPAGSAEAVQDNLNAHTNDKNNPHGVTAKQVGADPAGSASAVQGNLNTHTSNKNNPHGVTAAQVGTYEAEKIMASGIPAMFGLGAGAVPSDVLAYVGKYAQHWWRRRKLSVVKKDSLQRKVYSHSRGWNAYSDFNASNSVDVNYDTKELSLSSPSSVRIENKTSYPSSLLKNKYFELVSYAGDRKVDVSSGVIYFGETDITTVTSGTDTNYVITCSIVDIGYSDWEYVQSPNRSEYPDFGEQGGYEYQYLGIPFENAATAPAVFPKIATGSYVGTGKYGPDNPNSLTFDGNPQMVVVSIVSKLGCAGAYQDYFDGWSEGNFMWVKGATYSGGYSGTIDILETEHGISWNTASNQDASKQCNESGKTYRYFAIVN